MGFLAKAAQMADERIAREYMAQFPSKFKKGELLVLIDRNEFLKLYRANGGHAYKESDFPKKVPIPKSIIENYSLDKIANFGASCVLEKKEKAISFHSNKMLSKMLASNLILSSGITTVAAVAGSATLFAASAPIAGGAVASIATYKAISYARDLISHLKNPSLEKKTDEKKEDTLASLLSRYDTTTHGENINGIIQDVTTKVKSQVLEL